jgi:hypothetical protein
MIDIEDNKLKPFLKKIEDIVLNDKELSEKINQRVDQTEQTKKNPFRKVMSVKRTVPKNIDISWLLKFLIDLGERDEDIEKIVLEHKFDRKSDYYEKKNYYKFIYKYAKKVIKGRWKEAENKILKENEGLGFADDYVRKVLAKYPSRWKEYEDLIGTELKHRTEDYLELVLSKIPERWIELENFIQKVEAQKEEANEIIKLAQEIKLKEKQANQTLQNIEYNMHLDKIKKEYDKILAQL